MRYRPLGESGPLVSAVGLGCNSLGHRVGREATHAIVDAAIESGITLFDTADVYGTGASEQLLGEALRGRRDRVVIATKFGHRNQDMGYGPAAGAKGSRAYIRHAVHGSLRRLGTEYIDLYQLHTPDPHTPVQETLAALGELAAEGKVRWFGHSNFSAEQITHAARVARHRGLAPFISAQHRWSLLERASEADVLPAALRCELGVLPYAPLANGLLTGKVRTGQHPPAGTRLERTKDYLTEERINRVEALIGWATARGRTVLEVAVGALAARPGCASVIAGATSPRQVTANAKAGEWVPTQDDLTDLDRIVPPPA